jgi:nitrate/nitrite transporter NarK
MIDSRRFYYGWINLIIAAAAMVATLPGRTQGLGLVTEPIIADLRVERTDYAAINVWATLIGSLFCLPVGRLTDRWGARLVTTTLVAALGATVVVMSLAAGWTALFITITLTRGFGQSALSVVSLALVGKWFARRLNVAMGIYALLVGVGFVAAFPLVGQIVQQRGWRMAWLSVGVALLAATPVTWLAVRDSPETAADPERLTAQPSDLTWPEALRSSAFWTFALASALFGLVYSGIALFNESILQLRGFDASTYYLVLAVSAMVGLIANFAGGWLATWWPIQRVMGLGMAALAIALLMLPLVRTQLHVMVYALTMGVSGGIVTVVFFSVWGQVFGRAHLGRIQGAAQTMTVLASAIGPLLLAESLERTGSYDVMFYGLAAIVVALGFACWFVALPERRMPVGRPAFAPTP